MSDLLLVALLGVGGYLIWKNLSTPVAPSTTLLATPAVPLHPVTVTGTENRPVGSACAISPKCNPGQMCAQYMISGQIAADGTCQPITFGMLGYRPSNYVRRPA